MDLQRIQNLMCKPITLDGKPASITQSNGTHANICDANGVAISLDWFSVEVIINNRQGKFYTDGTNNVNLDGPSAVEPIPEPDESYEQDFDEDRKDHLRICVAALKHIYESDPGSAAFYIAKGALEDIGVIE